MPHTKNAPPLPSLADHLDQLRDLVAANGTRARLAERIGVSKSSLTRSLEGRDLSLGKVLRILGALEPPRGLEALVPED